MRQALEALGERLAAQGIHADIVIAGGAWMALVLGSREVTKDIDAYVAPPTEPTRQAAHDVAFQLGLPVDWLNDGIKGFFYTTPPQELWQEFAGLAVYTVTADYMLALKVYAARVEDQGDVQALLQHLGIGTLGEILTIVERYIPQELLTAKHRYFAESCLQGMDVL
jgi:predicted nucleotidyltransferase